MSLSTHLEQAIEVIRRSQTAELDAACARASERIASSLADDLPLLVCGNGGSAADAQHIAGELVGRFLRRRRALNCIALSANPSVLTAWANDEDYETIFARQVEAHGRRGAVLLAISTSGNSANVVRAAEAARALGMTVVALTGNEGGHLADLADELLNVPASETPAIQQVHLCIYHHLCARIEELCG